MSYLEGEEYDYISFVTNSELSSEEVVEFFQNRGNCENYIKNAKLDMLLVVCYLINFDQMKRYSS